MQRKVRQWNEFKSQMAGIVKDKNKKIREINRKQ